MEIVANWLTMDDQVQVYRKKWFMRDEQPRAILQLSHGMAEHVARYDDFAKYLVKQGIFVYGNDHRGHGQTGKLAGCMGYFAEENGFDCVVDDLYRVNECIHQEYPDTPIILMGHSMGSFLARRYIQKYANSIQAVIISGTACSKGLVGKIGKILAKAEMRKSHPKAPSPLLNRLSFGSYNKNFPHPRTAFDWISSDPQVVEKYIDDPLCGFICSSGFFYDLLTGLELIHDNRFIQNIPKTLPMLIFSGEKDPVGNNMKGVQKVITQYKDHGLQNIEVKLFQNGRHEMLHEINKQEVYDYVYQWMDKQI